MNKRQLRVLVVDDNRSTADALAKMLRHQGDLVEALYDGQAAIDHLAAHQIDVVLTDLRMEPVDGLKVLEHARKSDPAVEVILFTAYGDVGTAVEAMRLGARDFLTKPVPVEQVLDRLEKLRGNDSQESSDQQTGTTTFIAHSSSSKALLEQLKRVADVPTPVWIEGDVGSGRGHAATMLHHLGRDDLPLIVQDPRSDQPWPEAGTVILANVDDLSAAAQFDLTQRLSRATPELRLVATSGPGATQKVTEGKLRRDLYYALAVVVISMPRLRDRTEDILPLMEHGLDLFSQRYRRPRPDLSAQEKRRLTQHAWPGNVRELMNLAERAVVMGTEALTFQSSPNRTSGLPTLGPGFVLSDHLEAVERAILLEALKLSDNDRTQMSRLLGVERNTLRYKLKKYNLLD